MDLYGKKDKSIPRKIILIALELIIIIISYWILFRGGYYKIFSSANVVYGNGTRHVILFTFSVVVFLRTCVTIFYLLKRRIPWEEAFSIPFAFGIYYIGYALLGYKATASINGPDIFAIFLFIAGSFLNTGSELLRDKWKKDPLHKGRLYTSGFFKYSMHINYFGDFLWVSAYAIITRNLYAISIPIFICCFFVFYNIPKLDKYLAGKYGQQFEAYRKKTEHFIPFIY